MMAAGRTTRADPQRTCVGCRRVASPTQLVRFVAGPDGPVEGAGRPGRGAWLCPSTDCLDIALRRGGLARALRVERAAAIAAEPRLAAVVRAAATQRDEHAHGGR